MGASEDSSRPIPWFDRSVRAYLASAYPTNHRYRVVGRRLWPTWKLRTRYRRIRVLYPRPLVSLVDLSSSLGYFVLQAALRESCPRVLGIDLHEPDLRVSEVVRDQLGLASVRLERLRLHELSARIEAFGGPFQTALVLNVYHYLYFGSTRSPEHYESHAEIFESLRSVCSGTLVFSNCVELGQLPENVRRRAREQGRDAGYDERSVRTAAERWFTIEEHGKLGRRPLWRLTAR